MNAHGEDGTDQQVTYKVSRKSLVRDTKRDLSHCLESVHTGLSLSSLANFYKEEMENDLESIANVLGYSSIELMLNSSEFSDIVVREVEVVDDAVQDVYKSKTLASATTDVYAPSQLPETMEDNGSLLSRGRRAELLFGLSNEKVMQGKERLITTIANLGGERNDIVLIDVQKQYYAEYGVLLDKAELRKFFSKSHIKHVFDVYMSNEVEVTADAERTGSLYIRLKKPFSAIKSDFKRINDDRFKANTKSNYKSDAEKALQDFTPCIATTANEAADMYAPLRRLNQTTNGTSAFSTSQDNGILSTSANVPSKFSLANNSVNEAYSFSDMNGLSKASMAPFAVKKDAKETPPAVNGQSQAASFNTLPNGNATNGQNAIDMFFTKNATASSTRFERSDSVNLMELDLHSAPKKPLSTEEILLSYNNSEKNNSNANKNIVDDIIASSLHNFKNQLSTADGNGVERAVGNVEELQQILANSRNRTNSNMNNNTRREWNNATNVHQTDVQPTPTLTNSQSTSSSIGQKKEKQVIKYTKRGDGEFTDDESSSEDELEEGNRQVQIEEQIKSRTDTVKDNYFNDEYDDFDDDIASVASFVSNGQRNRGPDVIPSGSDEIKSNVQRNGCHAEKYLRLAAIQQEENDARRMAHRIAQLQRFNPTASVEELFANKSAKSNGHFNMQKGTSLIDDFKNFEVSATSNVVSKSLFDGDFIDEDFAKSPARVAKSRTNSAHLTNIFSATSAFELPKSTNEDETQNEIYILAANVCSIVMSRKPSIMLNELMRALEAIYGRMIIPGREFAEGSWQLFLKKYCRNVSSIEMPSDLLLIWKTEKDKEFKEMMANVGKISAQRF